ncbi:MAG: hypothetical protein JWL95_2620 [Gemmatimonadetes bacterium]|nr:hypothetical protein [Gemmatimonadota bacterium]
MTDEQMPEPEPTGALVPPPRNPPTAIATASPLPPHRPSRAITPREGFFRNLVQSTLNALDDVGDSIAHAIGLR